MRVTEWTIHGWDLARALNADDSLDAELIEWGCCIARVRAAESSKSRLVRSP
jgi:hypothetical protein